MKNERPNGQIQGDSRPMTDKGGSLPSSPDFTKSLAGKSRSELKAGYCDYGRISRRDTGSDKGFA